MTRAPVNYLMEKLARLLGLPAVDNCARLTGGLKDVVERLLVSKPFKFPGTNYLTSEVPDPEARMLEFKVSPSRISRRD